MAPLNSNTKHSKHFGPDAFTPSADGTRLRCPNGQETTYHSRSAEADGVVFHFDARHCQDCPLWSQCRDPHSGPASKRAVFISDYRTVLAVARAYQQTEAYRADRKLRPLVERFIAVLTRYGGARRARRIGRPAADFQAKMCGMACNLKEWMRLLARQERARA